VVTATISGVVKVLKQARGKKTGEQVRQFGKEYVQLLKNGYPFMRK